MKRPADRGPALNFPPTAVKVTDDSRENIACVALVYSFY